MAEDSKKEAATIPPYLPWPTFTAFIEKLNKTAVPSRIDATLIKNLSGTVQGQLLNALKFLDLTNGNGAVTERLKMLVRAYATPNWPETLNNSLGSYDEIIGVIDLETATPGELRERFREVGGIEGDTVDKAMRFYLNALKDAGMSYSPHLKIRQRAPRSTGRKSRRTAADSGSGIEYDNDAFAAPEDTFKIPLDVLGVNAVMFLPTDINQKRWEAISQYVKTVIGLRTTAMGGDDETENQR